MDDLNLKGSADFTALFESLDQLEVRMTRLAQSKDVVISPKLDLSAQFKELDALEDRLTKLGVKSAPTQRPTSAPTPTVNPPAVGPSDDDVAKAAALKQRLTEVHNIAAILRNDFIAAGTAADITDEEVAQLQARVVTLQTELKELRPIAEQTFGSASREVKQLSLTTAQLQRTITGARGEMSRLGIASQFKTAIDNSVLARDPQASVNGAVQLVRVYEQARLSSLSLQRTLERQNASMADASKFVDTYAAKFNVVPSQVEQTIKVLLNNEYTMSQAQETLERYAASALVAAKDVGQAVDALASDVQMGTTVMSNQAGINANQATAWAQYAKSIGVATEALTGQQKAEGFLVALRRETASDMREVDTILQGVGGTLGKTSQEFRKAQLELGEALLPTITNGAAQVTKFLQAFNSLDPEIKNTIVTAGLFAVAWGGVRMVLGPVLGLFKSAAPWLKNLATGGGAAAKGVTALGETALNTAGKTKVLTKGLKDISEVAAEKSLWTKLGDGAKALFTPIRNGMPILNQFIKSLATSPATKGGLYGAVAALGYGVGRLIGQFVKLKGLTLDEHVQNAVLKTGYGYSQQDVNNLRIEEARNAAFTKVLQEQVAARAKLREEKNKDLRSSGQRTLNIERDLAVERAALDRAKALGDSKATLAAQDRIKTLTQALGFERQNLATVNASILAAERQRDADEKRRPVLEALRKTQAELAAKAEDIRIGVKSDFARDIAEIARDFRAQRRALEDQLKNEKDIVIRLEIQKTLGKVDRVEQATLSARVAEEIKSGQSEITSAQQQVEQTRLNVMREGAGKRQAELKSELNAISNEYGPKIKAALENAQVVTGADRSRFQNQAGELQRLQAEAEKYAREGAARDLVAIRKEENEKTKERRQAHEARLRLAEEAEGRVVSLRAAAADGMTSILEGQRDRELKLYGTTAEGKLAIEQRYEGAITASRVEAARLQAENERQQLARTYQEQMRVAAESGDQRGRLELAARNEYNTAIQNLERTTATTIEKIQTEGQERVTDARLALQQQALDKELAGIRTATGAELASFRVRLEARRQMAIREGDVRTAEQLAAALREVESLNIDRVKDLKKTIADAAKGAGDLRQRLLDALPRTAMQKALSDAASPFNGVIKDAQERLKSLQDAFGKVAAPTDAQRQSYLRAVQEQESVIQAAQLGRNQAVLTAEQLANRERLAGARALAREELQAAVKNARNDTLRTQARARLQLLDESRLTAIAAELKSLDGRAGAEDRIAALKREQWGLESDLAGYTAEQRQEADNLLDSVQSLTQAQKEGALSEAEASRDTVRARALRLSMAQDEVDVAGQRLAQAKLEGRGAIEINQLEAARLSAQTRFNEERRKGDAEAREEAENLTSSIQTLNQARQAGALSEAEGAKDTAAARLVRLAMAQDELTIAEQRLQTARAEKKGAVDINQLEAARLTAQTHLNEERRKSNVEAQEEADRLLDSYLSLTGAQVQLSGELAKTDAALAQNYRDRVALAVREFEVADARLSRAGQEVHTEEELNGLRQQRLAAATGVLQAERELLALARSQGAEVLGREQARIQVRGRLLQLARDAVAAGRVDVALINQRRQGLEAQLALADRLKLSEQERRDLQSEIGTLKADEVEASEKLRQAEADRLTLARSLEGALRDAGRAGGAQLEGIELASRNLTDASRELERARDELAPDLLKLSAGQPVDEQTVSRVQALAQAYQGQREAMRGLAAEYRKQVEAVVPLEGALKRLADVLNPQLKDGPTDITGAARNLNRIEQRRTRAMLDVEKALTTGDDQALQQALTRLAESEEVYRKELERLKGAGLEPYMNLQVQQTSRVTALLQRAQARLDVVSATAEEAQQKAEELEGQAKGALSGPTLPNLTAQAIEESLKNGSKTLSDRVLEGLVNGADIVAKAIRAALTEPARLTITAPTGKAKSTMTSNRTLNNTFNITTQPGQDVNVPELAREVVTLINQNSEVYDECQF